MEGIILIILSLIISSFFGNKKKETQQTPPPVRQKQPVQTKSSTNQNRPSVLKELENWSKQMLEETEQKMSPQTKEVVQKAEQQARERFPEQAKRFDRQKTRLEEKVPTVIEQTAVSTPRTPERPGRLSMHQQKTKEIVMEEPVKQLVNSREELAQAIVLSEVLAPPVSKRR